MMGFHEPNDCLQGLATLGIHCRDNLAVLDPVMFIEMTTPASGWGSTDGSRLLTVINIHGDGAL